MISYHLIKLMDYSSFCDFPNWTQTQIVRDSEVQSLNNSDLERSKYNFNDILESMKTFK